MGHPALGLLLAYLAGSIPFAYIAGKAARGIDLRQHGSGNLGATNVYRLLGAKVAVVVLLLDAAKGALPVIFLPRLLDVGASHLVWAIAYGIAAIVGHVRPIFLLWKGGGKGVATASGVFAALAPLPILVATAIFALVLWAGGYVSLASLAGAAVLPFAVAAFMGVRTPVFAVSALVAVFVFWTHRANIGRLMRGQESRVGRGRFAGPSAAPMDAPMAGAASGRIDNNAARRPE